MAITWEDLVAREPALADLLDEVRRMRKVKGFKAGRAYPEVKRCLSQLVGWDSRSPDPALRTSQAWDAAFRVIKKALFF